MRHALRLVLPTLAVLLAASTCEQRATPPQDCAQDGSCTPPVVSEYLACTTDSDCPSGMCGRDGLCVGTQQCFVTAECPIDMYCNIALALPLCAPLGPGACREDSHCPDGVCSGVNGGLGSCLQCLEHADCASGTCAIDGTCAPDDGSASALSCPDHAHAEGDVCVCDEGWVADSSSTGCVQAPVVEPPSTTPEPTPTSDSCELGGLYGDGSCDPGCPQPDPDCEAVSDDVCERYDYYGDGECDTFCPEPDPDCEATGGDICEQRGYYDDGVCDAFCPEPDPDCDESLAPMQEGDPCGNVTYYGQCDGNRVIYCYQDAIDIVECSGGAPYCGLVSTAHGYDCMATPG